MNVRFFLFSIFVFGVLAIPVIGQVNNSFVCANVENKIFGNIEISKTTRRAVFDYECNFQFDSGKEWFSISIDKHKTQKESRKDFSDHFDFLTFNETYPESVQHLKKNNFWSEAKGYSKSSDSDHLIMLRYRNINILLISSKYELILKIEQLLREINFEQYSS